MEPAPKRSRSRSPSAASDAPSSPEEVLNDLKDQVIILQGIIPKGEDEGFLFTKPLSIKMWILGERVAAAVRAIDMSAKTKRFMGQPFILNEEFKAVISAQRAVCLTLLDDMVALPGSIVQFRHTTDPWFRGCLNQMKDIYERVVFLDEY